ncbi:tetratricopeptide repeat protein [Thermosulfidibacter takaii]|nr:tetratricopeptide repeat protein [Thermosulfidibacter takaii]
MARAYLEGADYKKAKMEILKAIELRKTPEAYNILGLAYYGLGEYKEAEKAFKKAVELDPDYSTAWNNLSACYIAQKKYKKAIEAAKKALSNHFYLYPEKAYVNIAEAYFGMGDPQKALEYLDKALRYNVYYAPAYEKQLDYYLSRGDIASAKSVLFDARAAGVESPGIIFYRALIMIREGNLIKAKELLKSLTRDYPMTPWAKRAKVYLNTLE